jgi:excisionase family DNA binding protein
MTKQVVTDLDVRPGALLSINDAAAAIGAHPSTIYRLFDAGELTKIKILGRVRVQKDQLIRIIQQGTITQRG